MAISDASSEIACETAKLLRALGVETSAIADGELIAHSPITGEAIGRVRVSAGVALKDAIGAAEGAFRAWRDVPAPRRGELVRLLGKNFAAPSRCSPASSRSKRVKSLLKVSAKFRR